MHFGKSILIAAMLASVSTAVLAQDWTAERLRGQVLQFEHGDWTALERGDVVPDGRKIRTGSTGRVELVRGQERIALAGNTEVEVRDAAGQKMTSVLQFHGSVTIEAERRNVQHFSVQTPVLAAVVKGTQFTVTYRNGQARVDVDRGVVQVQDSAHDMVVDVTPGQAAEASQMAPVDVSGPGSDRVVYLIEGNVVPAVAREAVLRGDVAAEDALDAVRNGTIPNANARANANANANSAGQGNAVSANARASNNGNGNSGNSGPPSHSNAGGNGNGPPAHSNAGGNSSGAGNNGNGNGNGPPSQSNTGGNGDDPPEHSNAGGNSSSGSSGSGNGPPEHSNAGGNGKGNGKKDD
ncbi:FecR family protein [Devosia salina]|uniref:FecR family protein n=1 Tax=Devosia salina TaxID=2860336 RepID=A0ABX8WDN7_9HYPH|nr:FecR family protein [Devosia salina]QYO75081.1 FecR family protein [Devosia salina]